MNFDNTLITSASGYDVKNIIYTKPKDGSIPNSAVTFKRIQIGTKNPDGSCGELILETERLFSFGLSPNINMNTGKTDGYTLALCMWNLDNPSKKEKDFTDTFNKICEYTSEYILEHRDDICKYELEKADLKKFNPLYLKKDKGKVVEGSSPMLYAKVLQNKKTDTITSIFYDEHGHDLDPMTLMNKQCYVKAAIKIEGIFIGSKVSLQVKLHEAEVKLKESGIKRLLRPSLPVQENFNEEFQKLQLSEPKKDLEEEEEKGSLKEEDLEDLEEKKSVIIKPEVKSDSVKTVRKPKK